MSRYLLQRFLQTFPVMIGITCLTFALMYLTSGDPAEIMLRASGVQPSTEAVEAMRQTLGLNLPIYEQYFHWLWRVLHLDLGVSYATNRPVFTELMDRFPAKLILAICAVCLTALIALPLGVAAALYPGSWVDRIAKGCSFVSAAMPGYWLGLLFIYYLSVKLRMLPMMGMEGITSWILPAITLAFGIAGVYIRLIRSSMIEVLKMPYIQAAKAKGLSPWVLIGGHGLRNALLPSLTLLGIHVGSLLGGSVIVETIFSWPGVGKFAVDAIFMKDYIVIQGYVLLMAVLVVFVNLAVDIGYLCLDPRIRLR